MSRTVFDCARVPHKTCSVQIIGDRDEVLQAAKQHLVSAHGHDDNGQLEANVTKVVDDQNQEKPYDSWF
jgi:predicted small metal-binding protein